MSLVHDFVNHTLTIVKEYCLSLFTEKQWCNFLTIQEIAKITLLDSWKYLHDNNQSLPANFENAFA